MLVHLETPERSLMFAGCEHAACVMDQLGPLNLMSRWLFE